jgi:hypothetical protein
VTVTHGPTGSELVSLALNASGSHVIEAFLQQDFGAKKIGKFLRQLKVCLSGVIPGVI